MSDNKVALFSPSDFFEHREIAGRTVGVIMKPMNQEQARLMFPYRPFSKYAESRFGGNTLVDDIALILNRLAKWCKMCTAATKNEHLTNGICPDCDGRSEYNGMDPRWSII